MREDLIARQRIIKTSMQSKIEAQDRKKNVRETVFISLSLSKDVISSFPFMNTFTNHADPTHLCNIHISTALALHVILIDQFCSR
jgi:hypothetical protein